MTVCRDKDAFSSGVENVPVLGKKKWGGGSRSDTIIGSKLIIRKEQREGQAI